MWPRSNALRLTGLLNEAKSPPPAIMKRISPGEPRPPAIIFCLPTFQPWGHLFWSHGSTAGRWELYWIAVDPRAHRSGLGKRLEAASEEAVRAMGGVMLIAETSTRPDYNPARRFYLAQGYRLLAEIPDWHDEGNTTSATNMSGNVNATLTIAGTLYLLAGTWTAVRQ